MQASDRRADLAREGRTYGAVGPVLRSAAERANRAAGEEVVGAQRRHGIARQQEDQALSNPAHAGRAARPHGDAVYRQFAVSSDQRRRVILDAHARAAGDDDDVRVRVQGRQDRLGLVANQAGEVHERAVALGECGEHRSVGVGDLKIVRRRARGQQLVAGNHKADARPADDRHVGESDRAHDTKVLRTKHTADVEHGGAGRDILTAATDVLAGRESVSPRFRRV